MDKFEFKGFISTPSEKHVGIAEVKVNGITPIILRFKIVPKRDGTGYFPGCASYKMPGRSQGEEYDECFMVDSRSDNDAMIRFVLAHVNHALNRQQMPNSAIPLPPGTIGSGGQFVAQQNLNLNLPSQPAQDPELPF